MAVYFPSMMREPFLVCRALLTSDFPQAFDAVPTAHELSVAVASVYCIHGKYSASVTTVGLPQSGSCIALNRGDLVGRFLGGSNDLIDAMQIFCGLQLI